MAVTAVTSNKYKEALINKLIDLDNDSIKVLLMRSGFVFDKQEHHILINLKTVNAAATINANAAGTFIRTTGSFVTDGFVVGNEITGANFPSGGNNAVFEIASITTTTIADDTITVVDNTGMVTEGGDGDETLTSNDELATGNGYTQDTKTTGATTVTLDNVNNYGKCTFPTVSWTAAGGSIGPSPGAILYDDTTTDNIIIGYIDFGAEITATTGIAFDIQNGEIREV